MSDETSRSAHHELNAEVMSVASHYFLRPDELRRRWRGELHSVSNPHDQMLVVAAVLYIAKADEDGVLSEHPESAIFKLATYKSGDGAMSPAFSTWCAGQMEEAQILVYEGEQARLVFPEGVREQLKFLKDQHGSRS